MISKQDFLKFINIVQEYNKFSDILRKNNIDITDLPHFYNLNNLFMDQVFSEDNKEIIEWWLYDQTFFRKKGEDITIEFDPTGETFILNTPEQLYDYLEFKNSQF